LNEVDNMFGALAKIDMDFVKTNPNDKEFAVWKYELAYDCMSGLANHLSNWLGDDNHMTNDAWGMMETLEELYLSLEELSLEEYEEEENGT